MGAESSTESGPGPGFTASRRVGGGIQSDTCKVPLNSADRCVSLQEDPELQEGMRPSRHVDVSLWGPERRARCGCARASDLQKLSGNTLLHFKLLNLQSLDT